MTYTYNGDRRLIQSSEEEEAYTRYAQSISKNFTTAFLSALPRELRDHVYSYLWDDEDIVRQTKRSVREYAWSYRMPEFCAPSYVQPDHVGRLQESFRHEASGHSQRRAYSQVSRRKPTEEHFEACRLYQGPDH